MGNAWLEDPEVRLMLDVKAGHAGAFEDLVARYAPILVNFLARQAGNPEDAEDLAQEVFSKVYRARETYEPAARFRTWILTIATNLCLNRRRYEGYRFHYSLNAPVGDDSEGGGRDV